MAKPIHMITALLFVFLILNIAFWIYGRSFQVQWMNVPPVPTGGFQQSAALGDAQLAYRSNALMIQTLGDHGGRVGRFADYDYERLVEWLFLMDRFDAESNFIAYLAAYYFGATSDKEQLRLLTRYLAETGDRPDGEKWRWLAHAAYLARFEIEDLDLALKYADRLSALERRYNMDLPGWASQMHVFVRNAMGDKREAYGLMLNILETEAHRMHPAEVNFVKHYICERILSAPEAGVNPLCEDVE